MADAAHVKSDLREQLRAQLDAQSTDERHQRSTAACSRLIQHPAFRNASTVMLYMPLEHELDVAPAALRCYQRGMTVCVPKVDWERREMCAVEAHSFDDGDLDAGPHGVRVPHDSRPVLPAQIDLIVVPGLGFDLRCRRLGRGGGYYDRFLAHMARRSRGFRAIGIGFDFQVVDGIPEEAHDYPLDHLITDRRTHDAN